MPTPLKDDHNLEVSSTPPVAGVDLKQRRRMLTALAVLLATLVVVIIRDRQFWFPPSPEPVAIEPIPAPATATATRPTTPAPQVTEAPRSHPPHGNARKAKHKSSPARVSPSETDAGAAVAPVITATSRAVLPPLEIEVVAGNQHRTLKPGSNSVKVDMQSSASGPSGVGAPEQNPGSSADTAAPGAGAQVSMSAGTAERVSHPVKPDYPLLAKQMKVQGAVVLQALIDKTGNIQDLHVVSGPAILSAAAQEAVKQWHFKPYYQGGQPVETEARITVNFTISTY